MIQRFAELISILGHREKRQLTKLLFVAIFAAIMQLVAILSIMPFISMLANPGLIQKVSLLKKVQAYFNFSSQTDMLMASGVFILVTLLLSNSVQAISVWQINKFGFNYGRTLSIRLLQEYIARPYLFFVGANSTVFMKNINQEVWRIVNGILIPLLQAAAGAIKILFIVLLLLVVNVWATLGMAVFVGACYMLVAYFVKGRLTRNGQETSQLFTQRFKTVRELFEGIKEVKLLGREAVFLNSFEGVTNAVVKHEIYGTVVGQLPRYFLEIITFGTLLAISIYLLASEGDSSRILPLIALFVIAGYRLMPAMQEVYANFAKIKFALPAMDVLYGDLKMSVGATHKNVIAASQVRLPFNRCMTLNELVFSYPGAARPALNGLSLDIPANSSIGLIGSSGSGKSTLVDVLLGLLDPQSGSLLIDDVPVSKENLREWQNNIGYVPQHIYLIDDTIALNIAFGVPLDQVDMEAVKRAAQAANLHDFIVNDLPKGYETQVGERGVRLSGGQRQRIGIARALYHEPAVLVMDEATSALDSVTESAVIEAVERLSGNMTTIMIAHRISTLKECDVIYRLVAGEVVESGNYEKLMASSEEFRKLANSAEAAAA